MWIRRAFIKASVAVAWTSVTFFTMSAFGQSPAAQPDTTDAVSEPTPGDAGGAVTDVSIAGQPLVPSTAAHASVPAANAALKTPPAVTDSAGTSAQPVPTSTDRYRDGIVIWETPHDADVPFLLKFNINTQLRYLNTLDSDETYTDHLGVAREVHTRNDITVNRAMFILGGYIFDQRAGPSLRIPQV